MKNPIIGITIDYENNGGYSKFPWYAIRENYLSCLHKFDEITYPLCHENVINEYLLKKIDGLVTYHLPNELLGIIWKGKFQGQKQQWYIMSFKGDDKEINIRTKHPEFLEWKWVDPDKITELVVKFKLHVYEKIQEEVKKILVN